MRSNVALASIAVAAALAFGGTARAEQQHYMATLTGGEEVPPTDSAGTGTATATYDTDTKEFTYSVEFSGLTGPANAAHFHGPAAVGENAGPVVPIGDLESPSEGSATLSDEQAADLAAGKWYVNVHTDAHPDGEIRGQVMQSAM